MIFWGVKFTAVATFVREIDICNRILPIKQMNLAAWLNVSYFYDQTEKYSHNNLFSIAMACCLYPERNYKNTCISLAFNMRATCKLVHISQNQHKHHHVKPLFHPISLSYIPPYVHLRPG